MASRRQETARECSPRGVVDLPQGKKETGARLSTCSRVLKPCEDRFEVVVGQRSKEDGREPGPRHVVSRLETDRGPEGGLGLIEIALLMEELTEFEQGLGRVGLDRDRGNVVDCGLIRSTQLLERTANCEVRVRPVVRGQRHHAIPTANCRLELLQLSMQFRQVFPVDRAVRVQLRGPGKLAPGLVEPGFLKVDQPEVGVGHSHARGEPDRFKVREVRLVEPAGRTQGGTKVVVALGKVRPERQSPADQTRGSDVISLLVAHQPEEMQSPDVRPIAREDLLIQRGGCGQIPCPV